MSQQTLDLISLPIISSPRPPCTCTCLLSNRTSSCTVSTPTHWTRTTLRMCSGRLLRRTLCTSKKKKKKISKDAKQHHPPSADLFSSSTTPSPGWHATPPPRTDAPVCPFTSWCSTRCTISSRTCSELEPPRRDQAAEMRHDEMVHRLPAAKDPNALGPHTLWKKDRTSSSSSSPHPPPRFMLHNTDWKFPLNQSDAKNPLKHFGRSRDVS